MEGANTFFNKGTNGRWKDTLSTADLEAYDQVVKANLTPDCARWMATGEQDRSEVGKRARAE